MIQTANSEQQHFREVIATLEAQARGMWRYRWRAVFVAWIVSVLGWLAVYSMPDVYEANARIYVDTENAIRPLLVGIATTSNLLDEVTVVTREMLSRPNLAEVARATDLDLRTNTDEEFEALLDSLHKRISVIGNRENIFAIAYRDADRGKAIAVVDSLVDTFVEKSLGADRSESSQAQSFLREQIGLYEARLTEAENRLARFKQENVAVMPGQQGDYFSRLQAARDDLAASRSRLRLAEERRAELMRQLEGEEPVFGIMPKTEATAVGFTGAKIRELEIQLEELRLRYTDKHPRIGQILDTIAMLRQQQAEEGAVAGDPGATAAPERGELEQNPVYQNMRIQLTNTEVEIASLRAEVAQKSDEIAELRRLVDTVPQVEAELNRLNRDYDVVKKKYEQLLGQLESASISENVEASIDEVQFRVIDPPFSALKPAGPQRALFLSLVLIVALGLGGALTFLLNMVHPVFFYGRGVTGATGMPVLGAVSLILSPQQIRRKKIGRLRFVAAVGALLVSFVLVAILEEQLSPIVRDLGRLAS